MKFDKFCGYCKQTPCDCPAAVTSTSANLVSEKKSYREFWLDIATPYGDPCDFIHTEDPEIRAKRNGTHFGPCATNIHVVEASKVEDLQVKYDELKGTLDLENDEYVRQVGTWKIVQRLEESEARALAKLAELEVQVEKLVGVLNWTRDGIQHFDDRGQVDHLCNEIDTKLTEYETWKGKL
jgi:hypothetical protein